MRDIIDKLTLIESTGLAGRKSGDIFRDPEGNEIVFNNLQFFPAEGGKLDSAALEQALNDISNQYENIKWMNAKTSKTGGFALVQFNTTEGPIYFGRYLEQVKPNFTDNFIPNQVDNYRLASKSAQKMQSGLTPQDLLTDKNDLTANDILKQLSESLGTDNPLYAVAYRLASGEPLPLKFPAPEGISFPAFRDYFCEILQPIALQQGQYTGNAGEAAEIFLDGSFQETLISFDYSKNAGLSDSTMSTKDGKMVKISSKGGRGAEASSKNLVSSIDELSKTPAGVKLGNKYKEIIEIIREVGKQGQAGAPLYLGVKYNIIDEKEADTVRELKNQKSINMDDISSLGLTDNLLKLSKSRTPENTESVNMYYHLLSVIAYKAAEKINDETDFSDAAADILNNGSLIQVYTKAKEGKTEWTLDEFNTVYPGTSIKGVYLSASKNYYSTGIKGNFTFKIDRGEGKVKDAQDLGREKRKAKEPTEKEYAQKAKDIALGKIEPFKKEIPAQTNVGREKR